MKSYEGLAKAQALNKIIAVLTLEEDSDLSRLTRLHLVGNVLEEPLRLTCLHGSGRQHLQRALQPSSGLLREQLEHGHHNPRRIREAVAREGKHHACQHPLRQNLALGQEKGFHGVADLGRVGVRFTLGASKFGDEWLFKREAEQVSVIVERGDERVDLLKGQSTQTRTEDGDGEIGADAFLRVVANGIRRQPEVVLDHC